MARQNVIKTLTGAVFCVFLGAGSAAANAAVGPVSAVISGQAIEHGLSTAAVAKPALAGQVTVQTTFRVVTLNFGPFHFRETEQTQAKIFAR